MNAIIDTLSADTTPEQMFLALQTHRHCVWLDSARVDGRFGRYSILTADPLFVFSSRKNQWTIEAEGSAPVYGCGDPFAKLAALVDRYASNDVPDVPFPCGGAFGYFSYELRHPSRSRVGNQDDDLPDCWFGFYDGLIVFDHIAEQTYRVGQIAGRDVALLCPSDCRGNSAAGDAGLRTNFTRDGFLEAIQCAKRYIAAGDIYQVNLSQRFEAHTTEPAADLYLRLRETNPAPFAAYLDIGSAQILSSSPERFLRLSGRHVQTRPIKGTRPRTGDAARDEVAARELMMSEKDQAELVMITDLERNDLGQVCEFGSVHVPELVRLEEYATVFHLVSTIEGRLRQDVSHVEAVRACFPGGSITGAPKIRAMEIIDELEPEPRGVYTGAIGYFGCNGESDFNIAIRTMIQQQDVVSFHAGSGIVADSDPASEYEETLAKASGRIAALKTGRSPATRPLQG